MTWIGLLAIAVGLYLAFRLVGIVLKLAVCALALVLGYALLASHMGWPGPLEIAYVLGPDVDGLGPDGVSLPDPGPIRDRLVHDVADAIVERVVPAAEAPPPAAEAAPCPERAAGGEGGGTGGDCR